MAGTMTLADVVDGVAPGSLVPEMRSLLRSVTVVAVLTDSRLVEPGTVFVALRGERVDGHDFGPEAIAKGAVAVIGERPPSEAPCNVIEPGRPTIGTPDPALPICLIVPDSLLALQQAAVHWRSQHSVRVIAVTGSIGKTVSKELIAAVLNQKYRTLKSEGNYNNEIGLPLTLLQLQATHERVVLEMGMYGLGEIARLAEIARPTVGVVTNVGPTHMGRLGTMERIAQAKAELPQALPLAEEGGVAILNADDPRVRAMSTQTQARVFTYGLSPDADLWADGIESRGLEGVRFRLHYGGEHIHAQIPILGRHSVHTALCAASVGKVESLSWSEIITGLQDQRAQLRLVAVPGPAGSILLDDTYNASPASSIAALNLLAELGGRKVAVLGEMYELGTYTQEGHRLVGHRASEVADLLIAVGELAHDLTDAALTSGMPPAAVHWVPTNAQAVALLCELIQPGDIILIKGSRGLRMEEVVSSLTHMASRVHHGTKET